MRHFRCLDGEVFHAEGVAGGAVGVADGEGLVGGGEPKAELSATAWSWGLVWGEGGFRL